MFPYQNCFILFAVSQKPVVFSINLQIMGAQQSSQSQPLVNNNQNSENNENDQSETPQNNNQEDLPQNNNNDYNDCGSWFASLCDCNNNDQQQQQTEIEQEEKDALPEQNTNMVSI